MRLVKDMGNCVLLFLLFAAAAVRSQTCRYNLNDFSLPSFGTDPATGGTLQPFGQYVPAYPGLTGERLWQIDLCNVAPNKACQGNQMPVSYIYEFSDHSGTAQSCDLGLSWFAGWFEGSAIDGEGYSVPSLNATFMNPAQDRVVLAALICGGTPDKLTPVAYPGSKGGWYTQPASDSNVWVWDIVFAYPVPGFCVPLTPAPNTTAQPPAPTTATLPPSTTWVPSTTFPPSTPPPAPPAQVCATANGTLFKLPTFNGTVGQWVPSAPALSGSRGWQVSLCGPEAPTCSGNRNDSFIFEYDPLSNACEMGLSFYLSNWTHRYGGLNSLFTNFAGDRLANVTLTCGPLPELQVVDTAPAGKGWHTHQEPNGQWVWDMWFTTSALPGC